MPDSDMDSVAHTMEGSGPFDPTVQATTPKKRKAKKKEISYEKKEFRQHWVGHIRESL